MEKGALREGHGLRMKAGYAGQLRGLGRRDLLPWKCPLGERRRRQMDTFLCRDEKDTRMSGHADLAAH